MANKIQKIWALFSVVSAHSCENRGLVSSSNPIMARQVYSERTIFGMRRLRHYVLSHMP